MNLGTVNGPSETKPNPETAHLSVIMTVHNFSAQYSTEQFWLSPLLPPDNHHISDVIYRSRRGRGEGVNSKSNQLHLYYYASH